MLTRQHKKTWQNLMWFLTIAILSSRSAKADPLATTMTFSTMGSPGTPGVTGSPLVSFQGVTHGDLTAGSPFNLGNFIVTETSSDSTETYKNLPFNILFRIDTINGSLPSPAAPTVLLNGLLNGTVTGNSAAGLSVYFDSVIFTPNEGPPFPSTIRPFQAGNLINYLFVPGNGSNGLPIVAELNVTRAVPEPSTAATFASIACILLLRSVRRARDVPVTTVHIIIPLFFWRWSFCAEWSRAEKV